MGIERVSLSGGTPTPTPCLFVLLVHEPPRGYETVRCGWVGRQTFYRTAPVRQPMTTNDLPFFLYQELIGYNPLYGLVGIASRLFYSNLHAVCT